MGEKRLTEAPPYSTTSVRAHRLPGGEADELVAVEEPLEIRIGGEPVAVTMRTPGHDEELALGFCLTEGLEPVAARVPDDLAANTVDVDAPGLDRERLRRNFYTSSSCGVCGKGAIEAIAVAASTVTSDLRVSRDLVSSLPDLLREAQRGFAATGGLHATGLFTAEGELECLREDVGRHNALDKVVGWAFLAGMLPLERRILCVSGRLVVRARAEGVRRRVPDRRRGRSPVVARGRARGRSRRHAVRLRPRGPGHRVHGAVADRLAATGILLLGGASSRFGSPKALARFRGETLAERAHRLLQEVCDEVVAVGKQADALDVPFPVLDDGVEERAPAYGVVAGLRCAAHDTCVFLPVDCPRVTAAMLRSLIRAEGVPQTGSLPGVYTKAMLAELEQRIAYGELSLRGLNPQVVELDEHLLANANTRMELLAASIADWAEQREDVQALVVVGSQARLDAPADRWSDLDAVLILDDPTPYLDDAGWVAEFGRPVLTFLEPTFAGQYRERRVLYETGDDVDFVLLPPDAVELMRTTHGVAEVFARGYRVLVDRIGLGGAIEELAATAGPEGPPSQAAFTELASDYWYHALWTAKKLRRGEVYTAVGCLDGYLKARLVTLLSWHARAVEPSVDTWHDGRFLERWADPGALVALEFAYARYSVREVAHALWQSIDLWQGLEEETARRLGLELELDHPGLRRRIAEVVPDPR